MDDNLALRTVRLAVPKKVMGRHSQGDLETWITMVEQILSVGYTDYTFSVTQNSFNQTVEIVVSFNSIEDATMFRLQNS